MLGGRLNASAALFFIRQNNRALVDPDFANACPAAPVTTSACYINAGLVESKGIDLEVNGEIARGLQAWAGYTYNRQTYKKDRNSSGQPTSNEGQQFNSATPKHILQAGASYRLPEELNAWTLGSSVTARSKTGYTSGGVARRQSGYGVWNAFVRYRINSQWALSLNVNNLFDKVYYQGAEKSLYGDPRNATLTLRGTF